MHNPGPTAIPSLLLAAALSAAALTTPARAQDKPQDPATALRGPVVKETAAPVTLVQRDMSGHVVRLETRPEEAAIPLLGLSTEERAAAEKVISDRFAKVSQFLAEHRDLFLKIQAARQGGGDPKELAPLMREFRDAAAPLLDKPLSDQVSTALPEGKRAEFARVVDEYKRALFAEGPPNGQPAGAEAPGPLPAGAPVPPRMEVNLLLREMGRSLQSTIKERRERFEELIRIVDATPEQQAKLQAIVQEKPKNGLRPTAEERDERERKIMEVLTPEQRRKLLDARRGSEKPPQ
jgi:hypothetical protein